MAIKDEKLVVKINSEEKEVITEYADKLDIPVSQFMREAAREKIAAIRDAQAERPEAAVAPV